MTNAHRECELQLELLRHWFLPPQHRETFRQSETAWGYDGAVKWQHAKLRRAGREHDRGL